MSSPSKKEEDFAAVSLTRAASSGDLAGVKAMLAAGADVDSANQSGQTALMLAAVMGHVEVVASLIEAGADPELRDRLGLNAMEWSTRRGFPEVSQLLAKISPPLHRPSPTKATSDHASTETRSHPATTAEIKSKVSQVGETVPTGVGSNEQIKTQRDELPTQATTEQPKSPEELFEPVAVATESVASPSASVEVESQPQELPSRPEPPKAESRPEVSPAVPSADIKSEVSEVSEAVPVSWSASAREHIKTEREELPTPATTAEQPNSPEELPEPVAVATESVASPSASVVESKPHELPSRPEPPKAESRPEVSPPVASADIKSKVGEVSEAVPVSWSASAREQIKTEREELPTPATSAEQPKSPEELPKPVAVATESVVSSSAAVEVESQPHKLPSRPEPPKTESSPEVSPPVPSADIKSEVSEVSEAASLRSSASGRKQIKTEREELPTPATTAEQPKSPEELPKPVAVASESVVSSSAAVEVESQPHKLPSRPELPKTESSPEVSPPVATPTNIPSAELQGIPDTSDQPSIEPSDEEEETLTQPIFEVPAREETLPNIIRPVVSPRSSMQPTPTVRRSAVESASAFTGSPLGLSSSITREDTAEVRNFKRCPKCNTVYQNTLFSYCSRDSARLIGINELQPAASANPSAPVAVWLLIAFVLGASAFAAYRLTQYLYRAEETAPAAEATTPVEPSAEVRKPFFTVGGDLAGMEVNVPEPPYPSELQDAGVTAPITVTIRVNRYGRVISAATSNGDRRLRSAAIRAARQATFAPDKLAAANPRRGVVSGTITYEFAPPQPVTATSTAPTPTDNSGATDATNADPNAPVISDTLAAAALNVPAAEYPSRARRAGVDGKITVTIRVSRRGKVVSWRTSTGDSQLRAAAIRAARKATFSPEKLQGTGEVLGTITYNFTP